MANIEIKQSNYLENKTISLYFEIFEFETYFTSIRFKEFSRNEYDRVIENITYFLVKTNNNTAVNLLNESIFNRRFEDNNFSDESNYYASINSNKIDDIELLALDDKDLFFNNLTISSIKTCYRKAAMTHHPDRGGSNEKMKALPDFPW